MHDQSQRERALNTTQSFIVQAPAGSGKTSLLVQRYLALLAQVNYPEEIIAITFTRKAAAEMQDRIVDALNKAASSEENANNTNAHYNKTLDLARQALLQNTKKQWNLLSCPYRLRLQTIDALCLSLVNLSPFAANIDQSPNIAQEHEANKYYSLAAQTILNELNNDDFAHIKHLETLLLALDNDHERCLELFVAMLQKREQWLPYIVGIRNHDEQALRAILEESLSSVVQETINKCRDIFPKQLHAEIIELLNFAHANLQANPANQPKTETRFSQAIDFKQVFFSIKSENTAKNNIKTDLEAYQKLAGFLLTDKGTGDWRKKVDKRNGFPAADKTTDKDTKNLYKEMKSRYLELIEQLQNHQNSQAIKKNLQEIPVLPHPNYNEQQWQVLCALVELLPLLAAELDLTFREHSIVDYTAISMAAERAFGDSESPSDMALHLDYRIQHILVDEFQDISQAQYRLLEKLTCGWENGDGRSLFLVGDPMQSIYRFRQAEVGLFLRAAQEGIGSIQPEFLQLTSNFRSFPHIVNWINQIFAQILPTFADSALGCIPFCAAHPDKTENNISFENKVDVSILIPAEQQYQQQNTNAEAEHVVTLIQKISAAAPQDKIAILVSARNHLNFVLPALKTANIEFNAVELENLSDSIVIQDLFSLTCALTNNSDRVAWLAILRAPWCGLCLSDLHAIANARNGENNEKVAPTILENLNNYAENTALSEDGKKRIARLLPLLHNSINNRGRKNLRDWISSTWLAIGGPATIKNAMELEHAEQFWQILENVATSSYTLDHELLTKKLGSVYASSSAPTAQVQIMTIHKAKGMEFDHVIVIGLERRTRGDSKQLLMWLERPRLHSGSDLLLAPLKEVGAEENTIYTYLRHIDEQKDYYESGRLLYVACTRAKKTLHLIATAAYKDEENDISEVETTAAISQSQTQLKSVKTPTSSSLLYQLWTCFNAEWLKEIKTDFSKTKYDTRITTQEQSIITTRLPLDWQHPVPNTTSDTTKQTDQQPHLIIDDTSARCGTVIHKCLLQLAKYLTEQKSIDVDINNYCTNNAHYWEKLLKQNGFYHEELKIYLAKIKTAITNILNDPKGQWILSSQHNAIHDEYAITAIIDNNIHNNSVKNFIIDRTFVTQDNTLWILDYKTSTPETVNGSSQNFNLFLENERIKYQTQLETYARAMQLKYKNSATQNAAVMPRTIMLGLYFPLCQGWYEWKFID